MHEDSLGMALVRLARNAIGTELGCAVDATPRHDALDAPGAAFVTLFMRGELRGCIGSIEPRRPLGVDVWENALGAAFRDARFLPLTAAEFDATLVEVSLLSSSERLKFVDEDDVLRQLHPGIDGVIVEFDGHRATFLPQVWDTLPEPAQFLDLLKRKAGLAAGFWSPTMNISRYQVIKWKESELLRTQTAP